MARAFVVSVLLCLSGCGLLPRNQAADAETRFVTRGQQPLVSAIDDRPAENPRELVRRARDLYEQGELEQARQAVRVALAAAPRLMAAINLEAHLALDLGDMPGYRAALSRMLQVSPESATVQNSVGKQLVESGDDKTGVQALSNACQLDPRNAGYARDLAAACLRTSHHETALRALSQAMRLNPNDTTLSVALARFHESAGNWGEAARYYEAALEANPHQRPWQLRQAHCYYLAEDYDRARDVYALCADRDASVLSLAESVEYGDACLRTGDLNRAQAAYDRVSRDNPSPSRDVELLRIICAIRRQDQEQANSVLQHALSLWPNDADLKELVDVVNRPAEKTPETE